MSAKTLSQIADLFVYQREERTLVVLAIKGCQMALNIISAVRGERLSENLGIQLLFKNLERMCLPIEIEWSVWVVTFVHQSVAYPPYELIKLLSHKHLILGMFPVGLGLIQKGHWVKQPVIQDQAPQRLNLQFCGQDPKPSSTEHALWRVFIASLRDFVLPCQST